MSKILVTGGSGFIGAELVNSLVKKGHHVISFDILHNDKNSDFQQFNGSILNPYDLDKAVKNCDMIVHLAAMVGVELTEKKRLECLEINIQGTKFILDAAVKQKVKKVFLALDDDAQLDAMKISEKLMNEGIDVRKIDLKNGDPNDIGFKKLTKMLGKTEETNFLDLMKYKLYGN